MKPTIMAIPPAERKNITQPGLNGVAEKAVSGTAGKLNLMDVLKSEEVGKYVNAFLNPILLLVTAALIYGMLSDIRTDLKELNMRTEQAASRSSINASRLDYLQAEINELKDDLKDLQKK